MTLGELLALPGEQGELAASITIGELIRGKASVGGVMDLRDLKEREQYDATVLKTLRQKRGPMGASALRSIVGGNPLQLRRSLNRLIEDGRVTYTGQARATRYSVVK